MSIKGYDRWAQGLHLNGGSHRELDACTRLLANQVIDIHHTPKYKIARDSKIFTIGSCFARSIESAFNVRGYNVSSHGLNLPENTYAGGPAETVLTKFNTLSMLNELQEVFNYVKLPDDGLIEIKEGQFWNPQLHRVFPLPKDVALEMKHTVQHKVEQIAYSDLIIITLGLTDYWYDNHLGIALNDTPKDLGHPKRSGRFEFKSMTYMETFNSLKKLVEIIFQVSQATPKIILTVSPVPLLRTFTEKDIIVANHLAKSKLRTVAQEICDTYDSIDYFPSYEIVSYTRRELAWKHDQRHVEGKVVTEIIKRFIDLYVEK
nr:GSCFA domain-containing protein [uncultured Desulfobulbus sp.]